MATGVQHVPEGLTAVIAQLVVSDARAVIAFAERVFGATDAQVMPGPDGGVMHGVFRIGGASVFVSDRSGFAEPTRANVFVYAPDVDAAVQRAVDAGATLKAPPMDMFWGDRWAMVVDPWGTTWQVATHVEDVPPEQFAARMAAMAR